MEGECIMVSEYKNILANKFMRDTNYIIIKDTDDLEELERQWELFKSSLTVRQQRLSDDRSIEIWNMTNQQHYEALKKELMEELEDKLNIEDPVNSIESEDSDDTISNDDFSGFDEFEDFEPDEEFKNYVNIPDDEEIPDNKFDINEPVKEDTSIPTDGKENVVGDDKNELGLNMDKIKDAQADQYEIDSNINIIGSIKGKTPEEHLQNLEKAYAKWNGQNQDHRKKSDDKCREIYGMSNIDRYNKLKADIYKVTPTEKLTATDVDANTVDNIPLPKDESFVAQVYKNMQILNEQESNKQKQHRRLNDTPYFTPSEMIDMGVHDNDNFYSPQADNDGLIQGTKIPTWFDSYKDMCLDHIFEDYTKEWIDTLDMLYSDFEQLKESGNEEKILARKQSILDLGWNPEIPFTRRNRQRAAKRISKLLDKSSPLNLFINLDKEVPDDAVENEPVVETARSETHQPVYMVFVQGKAPIISASIKKVTHSPYSHSGIAFDHTLETIHSYNMVPEAGLVRETLQGYKDNIITVMAFFAPNKIAQSMKDYVQDFWYNSRKTTYDFGILFNKLIKRNARVVEDKYHQVCSTFVDAVLKSGNVIIDATSDVPSPAELYNSAKTMPNKIIEVYSGPASKYNASKVGKKINKLLSSGKTQSIEESVSNNVASQIKLRPATQADTENMYNWEIASVDKQLQTDSKVISYIKKDVQESIKDTKMITHNGNTIGMLTACPIDNGEWWYIGEIYLEPEYRNKGIGTKLLKEQLKDHNKVKLQVAYSNTGARRLYESLGFKVIKKSEEGRMYVMAYDKNSINEAVSNLDSAESNDIYHNIEDWESGKSNVLWVTGLSGSGKSTISKEISKVDTAEHVELDNLQRAKMDNWDTTGSKLMDDYIASKGGLINIFSYVNDLDEVKWKDIVSNETECPKQFNDLLNYIMSYAASHKNKRYVIEGVQIAMCSKDTTISKISEYPVIIKMNGPLKTEFRREMRTIKTGIEKKDSVINILKRVAHNHKRWWQGNFYKDDWDEVKYFKTHIGESASLLNEVKQFPIEFDKEGNLIIYKCRTGSVSYGDEIADSVKLLESYRNANNIEGIKYELAKLWFINDSIEKKLKKRLTNDEYKELINQRAICLNVFKLNLEYVMQAEKGFNFSDYYNSTPFSDNSIKITANTIKYSMKALTTL